MFILSFDIHFTRGYVSIYVYYIYASAHNRNNMYNRPILLFDTFDNFYAHATIHSLYNIL